MRAVWIFASLISLSLPAFGAGVRWAEAPAQYRLLPDGAVEARDGGQSTGDVYLLTEDEYRDFIFEFDMTRLETGGPQQRSIVVWAIRPEDPSHRQAFFLPGGSFRPGDKHHIRLVVCSGRASLFLDARKISETPVTYGTPPEKGRVGFLHYYNYAYRYEKITLLPLEATALPPPTNIRAVLLPSGVARLTWSVPVPYQDVLCFHIFRAEGKEPTPTAQNRLAVVQTPTFMDRSLRSRRTYAYRIAPALDEQHIGQTSPPIIMRTGALPLPEPPRNFHALKRIDGSVRLKWRMPPEESRAAGYVIWAGSTAAEAASPHARKLVTLPLTASQWLAPASTAARYFALAVLDPDGRVPRRIVVAAQPTAPEIRADAPWPQRHPYLLYDVAQIERAKARLQQEKAGQSLVESLRRWAEATMAQPVNIPQEPTDGQDSVSRVLQRLGLAYQLIGDERYARWIREALLGYAKIYSQLPVHGGRARLAKTASGLYEAVWFVPLILAYDLAYDSPAFSPNDHRLIEQNLLRPAAELFWVRDYSNRRDPRVGDLHYQCYNFQAWFDAALGLTGLLLRDADMFEHAIDGPYGLKHLLAHDIHDDGIFWERSLGYHNFVLSALFPLLQAAYHCNLDLYRLAVPDDYNEDREPLANYCVGDGDNGPKSVRLLFDGPFFFTFPDLTWPVVADSSPGPLRADERYRAAWAHYQDPKYAWLLEQASPAARQTLYRGARDASAEIRVAWDEAHLYVLAQITDDVVRNTHTEPGAVWAGDALWIGLKWRAEAGGPYDFIYGLSPGDFGTSKPVVALFNRFQKPYGQASAAQLIALKTADGYLLEAAIPWSEFVPREGEQGVPLQPRDGLRLTVDFVIYDCDAPTGTTTKEKMIAWACTTDRYDSAQGGTLIFGTKAPTEPKTLNAPRVSGLRLTGQPNDLQQITARPARIGPGAAIMTDADEGARLEDRLYPAPPPGSGRFTLTGSRFCNNGILEAGCSLFPSTGFALLRDHLGKNGLAPRDATCVNLTYGPYGGGHGHPDKLSIVVYANGTQLVPDFGSCGYDTREKSEWTAHTVSHNTLTVDEISQYPAGSVNQTWPCDSAERQARGFLSFFHGDPLLKGAQAWSDRVYEGVHLRRTIALLHNTVFDFFEADSATEHTYDYVLHINAPWREGPLPLQALADPLGAACGYQHIHLAKGTAAAAQPLISDWGTERSGLRIIAAPGEPTQFIAAESITTALDRRMPMMILRRRASRTVFATILQPYQGSPPLKQWTWTTAPEGLMASTGADWILWARDLQRLTRMGPFIWQGALAAISRREQESAYALVKGVRLEAEGLKLTADRPASVYLCQRKGERPTLISGYDTQARLTIAIGGQTFVVQAKPRQTYRLSR